MPLPAGFLATDLASAWIFLASQSGFGLSLSLCIGFGPQHLGGHQDLWGLFSDGGIFATKPYICGSSYFMKMMDFKKGDWCNVMDGLYWRFIDRNRKFFLKNPRLSMMVRIFDKMKAERKKMILSEADKFIKQNTI